MLKDTAMLPLRLPRVIRRVAVRHAGSHHRLSVVVVTVLAVSQSGTMARTQANNRAPWAEFGVSVAASSDTIFVAASPMRNGQRDPGTVHVFQRQQSAWVRAGVLPVPEARIEDSFGISMATDGKTLVVGAQFADSRGDDSGLAYVFERSGEQWRPAVVISALDARAGDQFGLTVSVSGETIVVGARLADGHAADVGAAYVFAHRAGNWQQVRKLMASDAARGDIFGRVSIDADMMLVTADLNDDRGSNAGKAYAFENQRGAWVEVAKLTASDGVAGDEFGISLALKGSTAVFGAVGAAYVFERREGKWSQLARLKADDGRPRDAFGFTVAASDDLIVVGAPNHSGSGDRAGAAYVFERRGNLWSQMGKLTAGDAAPATWFGNSVAIGRDTIVVGMLTNGDGKRSGAAYVFERQQGRWLEVARLLPEVRR